MSGRKISSLLSMWEKKAEESNNNNSNTVPPKKTIFKKNVESKPVVDVPVVSSEIVETIPPSSNNEIIRNDPASNSSQPSAPIEETLVETNIEQVPSAPPLDETSHIETTQVETSSPTIENSLEETNQVVVEEIIPHQEEDNSTQVDQEIPSIPEDETQQIDIPSAPIPEETIETPQIEETTTVETPEEIPSEPIPEETPEETTIQGDFKVSLSEFKAIVGCSIMASSLEPLQKQLNFILEQNKCTRREDLPSSAIGVFDSLKVTLDMYMQNVFAPSSVLSSVLQQISTRGVTEEVKITMRVVLRHLDLFESDVSSLYSLSSLLIQLAFGTQDKIDLMMEFLRNPKAKALISKIAPEPSFKNIFGSLYPTLARTDFKFFYENYSETYFKSDLPPTVCASYCGQVYKEALRFPEYIEPFISEAVFSLVELAKLRNEPIEKLFCNGLYNMVKEAPEKFFKSEKYDDYVKALDKVKDQLFDSNKVFIDELFDLKNGMISDDSGEATAGEDFILMIEFNGKKKKTKESGNITFAQLVSSILEKFQVQQEHQSMNDLFDKGVIIEYFEESIKDWVEFERIEDIPRSPKVAKIKIVKEEIQINQISQIIERNTNIQLVNDKYQILKRIGKGGFGSVYSAYAYSSTESKPSLCALKYIEIDSIVNFNRSMREGIQMLQLDHANIARISDVFEVQSSDIGIMGVETKRYLCFAMPLYSHGDLYELIKNQSQIITAKLLGSIMKQLMDSLTYLHDEYSIVHRDIKPQNVLIESIDLINKTLIPILSDFGLAKTLLKTETQVAGTASYMSPEMSSRRGYNLSTDIWSMGVMFYQLLSFDFITDVKGKVQNNEFDSLSTQIERTWSGKDLEIISSLKKITFDMLNLNPEERPTAKQVFESLSSY